MSHNCVAACLKKKLPESREVTGDGGRSRGYLGQAATVSLDNSPDQKAPKTLPQEPQYTSAGPGFPPSGSLIPTAPTACLQDGQIAFEFDVMGSDFLSFFIEISELTTHIKTKYDL